MSQGDQIVPMAETLHIGKGALAFQVCIGSGKSRFRGDCGFFWFRNLQEELGSYPVKGLDQAETRISALTQTYEALNNQPGAAAACSKE